MTDRIEAVTAFVVRPTPSGGELLAYRHPTAAPDAPTGGGDESGVVLPEGAAERMEAPETAVVRLVRDACGLSRLEVEAKLGSVSGLEHGRVALTTSMEIGRRLSRGTELERLDELPSEVEVRHGSARKWLPRDAVTTDVVRHLFRVRCLDDTPARWTNHSGEFDLECFWSPVGSDAGLVRGHQRWLEMVRSELA